jgi:hypothetical protein
VHGRLEILARPAGGPSTTKRHTLLAAGTTNYQHLVAFAVIALWILTDKIFHSNLAIAPRLRHRKSTYHITDNARDPQRGLPHTCSKSVAGHSGAQRGGVLNEFYAAHRTVLAEGDLPDAHLLCIRPTFMGRFLPVLLPVLL